MNRTIMRPRERAKLVQERIAKAIQHPLLPGDARAALGEVALLLGDWGDILENLKGVPDGQQSSSGAVSMPGVQDERGASPPV
jgi:hypothetical protein